MHSQSIRRIARNHRQLIAALLAGLAGLLIVSMLRPGPLPTTTIVVASHRLPAGHVLTNDDLTTREWPTSVGEPPPLVDVDAARGRTIAGPLDAGELVSPSRLVGPDLLAMGDSASPPEDQATLVAISESGGKRRSRRHDRGRGHKQGRAAAKFGIGAWRISRLEQFDRCGGDPGSCD